MAENQPPADPRDARARAKADKAYEKARRPWYKKKRFLLPLLLLALIIVIAAVTTSGGGNTTADPTDSPSPSMTSATPGSPSPTTSSPTPGNGDGGESFPGEQDSDIVGQAGTALALDEVSVTSTPLVQGDPTLGPTLCTTVTVENGSDSTASFSAFDWQLQSPTGAVLRTSGTGSTTLLSTGELVPGGTTSGDVCFANESGESGQFVVLYQPSFTFSTERGAWLNTV